MVIKNVNLETVCGITSTLPENQHPEVAFSGKSNVQLNLTLPDSDSALYVSGKVSLTSESSLSSISTTLLFSEDTCLPHPELMVATPNIQCHSGFLHIGTHNTFVF